MTAKIIPFPGCKAFAREAIEKLKSLPDPRSNDKIVSDYTAAVLRGVEKWAQGPGGSVMDSISCSLIDAGIIVHKSEDYR